MWLAWVIQQTGTVSTDVVVGGISIGTLLTGIGTWITKVAIPASEKARGDKLAAAQKLAETRYSAEVRIAELEAQVEESRNAAILDLKNSTTEMSQSVKDLIKEIRENSSRQQERLERFVNQTDERFSAHSAQLGAVSALAHDAQHSARPAV